MPRSLTHHIALVAGCAAGLLLAGCATQRVVDPAYPARASADSVHPGLEVQSPSIASVDADREDAAAPVLNAASLGEEVALRALALVGKPYRYGGADLDGFDCSGLVYFIYHQLGIDVPRTAHDQQHESMRVKRQALTPGDLVFFKLRGRVVSHVGIYVGDNRFVHAPQSGKAIELRALDDQYFASRWVAAGRFD